MQSKVSAIILLSLLTFFVLIPGGCSKPDSPVKDSPAETAKRFPDAALHGLTESGKLHISESDQCPVCAMYPYKYPKFSCGIQLQDKRTYYFCGTGCLLRTWLHPEHFLGVDSSELLKPVVRDYFSGQEVDGREVTWITGSDIVGPMGPAIVPLLNKEDVSAFMERHGGKKTFTLAELDDTLWHDLTGKSVLPEKPGKQPQKN